MTTKKKAEKTIKFVPDPRSPAELYSRYWRVNSKPVEIREFEREILDGRCVEVEDHRPEWVFTGGTDP